MRKQSMCPNTDNKDALENWDSELPYWAYFWPTAQGLSIHLADLGYGKKKKEEGASGITFYNSIRALWEGVKVLEIGCGSGIVGIVLAKLGANVTQADYLQVTRESHLYYKL